MSPIPSQRDRSRDVVFVMAARVGEGYDFLRWFLVGSIRNNDGASGLSFGLNAFDDDAIVRRAELMDSSIGRIGLSWSLAGESL
jgi:hypothetical protein